MTINNRNDLKQAILELEDRKQLQEKALHQQFQRTAESLSPANLVKSTFNKITSDTDIVSKVVRTAAGLGIGMITKRIFTGGSSSLVKKFLGNAVEVGVTNGAINHADKIKAYGMAVYNNLFKKKTPDNSGGSNHT